MEKGDTCTQQHEALKHLRYDETEDGYWEAYVRGAPAFNLNWNDEWSQSQPEDLRFLRYIGDLVRDAFCAGWDAAKAEREGGE